MPRHQGCSCSDENRPNYPPTEQAISEPFVSGSLRRRRKSPEASRSCPPAGSASAFRRRYWLRAWRTWRARASAVKGFSSRAALPESSPLPAMAFSE